MTQIEKPEGIREGDGHRHTYSIIMKKVGIIYTEKKSGMLGEREREDMQVLI